MSEHTDLWRIIGPAVLALFLVREFFGYLKGRDDHEKRGPNDRILEKLGDLSGQVRAQETLLRRMLASVDRVPLLEGRITALEQMLREHIRAHHRDGEE